MSTARSVWLGPSTFVVPGITAATHYDNVIVAVVAFVLSLIPGPEERQPSS